jgi:formylglycine-generating enzyme required for sulfatase activity
MRGISRLKATGARMPQFLVQLAIILAAFGHPVVVAAGEADLDIPMVLVKGGCFPMGDTFGDGGIDEKPIHDVCVADFFLGKYEVTQGEWTRVMGSNPSQYQKGNDYPVENVSWADAREFIKKLRQETGRPWRLPTEAEWEYAARGGGKKQKYAGTSSRNDLPEYAWFEENADFQTHPVGGKKPNELGLYDMAGNVWEWVQDRYDRDYYRQSPRDNPKGDPFGVNRILKGGSAYQDAGFLRSSYRDYVAPEAHGNCVGLRLALPAK